MHHIFEHWGDWLGGATVFGLIAHGVNTFPPPENKYGQWFLGLVQFGVGQRIAGKNTLQGLSSTITASPLLKE